MRFLTWALACTLGGALGMAQADEPSKAPAPTTVTAPTSSDTATAPSTAPAAASTPAASTPAASTPAAKPDLNDEMLEKHFRAEGYKVQVRNGEKWYCKPMIETGTRLASPQPVCAPGEQLLINERQQREDLQKAQRSMNGTKGG
jgi:hypothetical protein